MDAHAAAAVELIYALLVELGVELAPAVADCLYTGPHHGHGMLPVPQRHPPHPPHRRGPAGARRPGGGHQPGHVREQVPGPGGGRAPCHGFPALFQQRPGGAGENPPGHLRENGASESDLDGIASLPREIQGVVLGVTLKEKEGKVKVSLRGQSPGGRLGPLRPVWRRRPPGGRWVLAGGRHPGGGPGRLGAGLPGLFARAELTVTRAGAARGRPCVLLGKPPLERSEPHGREKDSGGHPAGTGLF